MRAISILTFLGILFILASLSLPPLLWEKEGVIEEGTYDALRCDANHLVLTANATPCISAYSIVAELLGSGSELELNVTHPMILARGKLSYELRKGREELRGNYYLREWGALIPAARGYYELHVEGDEVEVFDIRSIREVSLIIEREGKELKIRCSNEGFRFLDREAPLILLYSSSDVSYKLRAYGDVPNPALLLVGVCLTALALVVRYARKSSGGEGETGS